MNRSDYLEEAAHDLKEAIKRCLKSKPIDPDQAIWELVFDALDAAYEAGHAAAVEQAKAAL